MNTEFDNLSITHFCDASESVRVMDPAIRPISKIPNIIGSAFTVKSHGSIIPGIEAIATAPSGSVVVIDTCGSNRAHVGDIFSLTAKKRGLAGIIIDGYCRDLDGIRETGLPLYARGISPHAGMKNQLGELQVPVSIGNIIIHPGEIIFADANGIIALSNSELEQYLPIAQQINQTENKASQIINEGKGLYDVLNFEEHKSNLQNARDDSKLRFTVND